MRVHPRTHTTYPMGTYLGLLKVTLGKSARSLPPETPSSAPPQSPFTDAGRAGSPFFSPPLHPPPPMVVPIVLTIKMNGKL